MILSWNITKRCNLLCKHCYRDSDASHQSGELTTEEGLQLITDIHKTGRFKILILSGGEPLLRDDLERFAAHAKSLGLIPVLGSNGTLITKERAQSLKEAGIAAAGISLDSNLPEQHDTFRCTKGAYEAALKGIQNCIEAGIRVQINTTVTKDNVEELDGLIDRAVELGAGALHPFFLVEAGRGSCITNKALNDKDYLKTLSHIIKRQIDVDIELKPTCAPQFMSLAKKLDVPMRYSRGCIAGIGYCCILPRGEVHVCPYLPIEAGRVREESFDDIWANSEVFNTLRNKENYEGKCGQCADHSICGGCRARAHYQNGHFLSEDPMSAYCFTPEKQLNYETKDGSHE